MKANNLKKILKAKLSTVCDHVYSKIADDENMYPHIVFRMPVTRREYANLDNITIDIDVWTKSDYEANQMVDAITEMFNCANLPQDEILPTFFVESVKDLEESDKSIIHKSIELLCENYER